MYVEEDHIYDEYREPPHGCRDMLIVLTMAVVFIGVILLYVF